jgi:hypothetical protein
MFQRRQCAFVWFLKMSVWAGPLIDVQQLLQMLNWSLKIGFLLFYAKKTAVYLTQPRWFVVMNIDRITSGSHHWKQS